jgi:hypothetical protein
MKTYLLAAAAALSLACGSAAHAETTVLNTSLGPVGAPGVTTTDATGTRSTKAGAGNVGETPVADKWLQTNLRGGAEVGITTDYARSGNGSISFYGVDGGSKADMEIYFSTSFLLSELEGASYDWYRDASSDNAAAQHPSLRFITDKGTYLIFEAVYNGLPTAPEDAWVTSTIGAGTSLWANLPAGINSPAPSGCTPYGGGLTCGALSAWQAQNPTARIVGLSTGIGSGWNADFAGAVDNISFTVGGKTTTYNFEVAAVPEPGAWALMIAGFGGVGAMMRRRRAVAA